MTTKNTTATAPATVSPKTKSAPVSAITLDTLDTEKVYKIPVSAINVDSSRNVRKVENYGIGEIKVMAEAVKTAKQGALIFPPIKVTLNSTKTGFQLYHGYRRMKSCEEAGYTGVIYAMIVKPSKTDEIYTHFTENSGKHLTGSEMFTGIKNLLKAGESQSKIAKVLGKSQSYVSQITTILNDKSFVEMVEDNTISAGLVTKILSICSNEKLNSKELAEELLEYATECAGEDKAPKITQKTLDAVLKVPSKLEIVKNILTENNISDTATISIEQLLMILECGNDGETLGNAIVNVVKEVKPTEQKELTALPLFEEVAEDEIIPEE